jgi:hypothetical protein
MKEKLLMPFAPVLVESTRSIGYSFETALADIIDNSVSNNARNVWVNFDTKDSPILAVIDDGRGMSKDELEAAMRYGSKSSLEIRDPKDLGRFGLGMKMASMSQCRKLTVVSKKNNSICGACWDLDYINSKGDWVLIEYSSDELKDTYCYNDLNEQKSGTIVLWEQFDRISSSSSNKSKVFDEKIEIARKHVSLVFHRFIDPEAIGQGISFYFNNERVVGIDPFLLSNPATQPLPEENIIINDQIIKVKPFVLPYASKLSKKDQNKLGEVDNLRQNQGFYIYRNKRLIIWGTWFRLVKQHELHKLARIRVDIPNTLDSIWEIDVKKSTANLPDIIKHRLVSLVENTIGSSEKVYKYRGRKTDDPNITHIWNVVDDRGQYHYVINRDSPLFKTLEDSIDEKDQGFFESFIQIVESSFPFEDVYFRLAKSDSGIHILSQKGEDEVYHNAVCMIEKLISINENVSVFIENMAKNDYFRKYPNVISKIKEEYK